MFERRRGVLSVLLLLYILLFPSKPPEIRADVLSILNLGVFKNPACFTYSGKRINDTEKIRPQELHDGI